MTKVTGSRILSQKREEHHSLSQHEERVKVPRLASTYLASRVFACYLLPLKLMLHGMRCKKISVMKAAASLASSLAGASVVVKRNVH